LDNTTDNTNKLITSLFIIGLSLNLFYVYFDQGRLFNNYTFGDLSLGPEKYLRAFSVIFIFFVVILSLFTANKNYLFKFIFAYVLIIGYITLNYLFTGPGIDDITGLMDTKGVGPWIVFGLIFVGFDDNRYRLFKKFLVVSVVVISMYVIYSLIFNGIGLYRGQTLARYRVYATNLVWITPFVFLILKNNRKLRVVRIFAIFIGISSALITITRSFLIIYFLVLVFDFFYTKKKLIFVLGGVIVGILFIYMLFNIESYSTSFDLLLKRGIEDTRTNQIIEFLRQLNFLDIIVGKGFNATYYFEGMAYSSLDNQWLKLIWWAGLIPAIMYFYLTAYIPFKLFIKKNQDYETRVEAFILILWTLACAGLAIYTTMEVEFFFFIICVIQGRLLYKYGLDRNYG
jgi:hypothetical protein